MTDLITTDLVRLGADWGQDKHDVIRALAAVVDDAGRATDKDQQLTVFHGETEVLDDYCLAELLSDVIKRDRRHLLVKYAVSCSHRHGTT